MGAGVSGCGGHSSAPSSGPTTTLITADHWTAPASTGVRSEANFCRLLIADYQHLGSLGDAANVRVKQAIVSDVVSFAPTVIAAAPLSILADASQYLRSIAQFLTALNAAGLNAQHLQNGAAGVLLDPKVKQAGQQVMAYSAQYCHYDIGS